MPFLQHGGVSMPYSRIPPRPGDVLVNFLAGHEECVIVEPIGVVLAKEIESGAVTLRAVGKKTMSGLAKQVLFKVDYTTVLDEVFRKVRRTVQVLPGQKALFAKCAQVDQQRIAGECRKALVRGIAVSGGAEWQHLPDFLP